MMLSIQEYVSLNARNKYLDVKRLRQGRGIGIINFEEVFPNFISDIMNRFQNSMVV